MKTNKMMFVLSLLLSLVFNLEIVGQTDRSEIDDKYKWDLTDIYKTEDSWKEAKEKLVKQLPEMEKFKGKLTLSASNLLDCFMSSIDIAKA